MSKNLRHLSVAAVVVLAAVVGSGALGAQGRTVTVVGLYSETDAGYVSSRVGSADRVVVKVGDKIPSSAQIRINVDRDWVELSPSDNLNRVYEIDGPDSGELLKKVSDSLKTKPKVVAFPKGSASTPDPKYKGKLVVGPYLGGQVYTNPDGDEKDIKYGDVLDGKGKVKIIAINNTIELMDVSPEGHEGHRVR